MTGKAPGKGKKTPAEVSADDLGRAAAKLLRDAPAPPLFPLLAHPTAAMAAATAIGFGLTTQMASAFLGAMQGAFDTADRLSKAAEADAAKAASETTAAPAEPVPAAEPPKAEPAVVAKAEKPAAKKAKPAAKAAKPVAAKAPAKKAASAKAPTAKAEKAPAKPAPAPKAKPRAASGKADDLKQISGIGPKLEEVLNSMGYRRFADIAKLDAKAIAKLEADTGLTGRIGRDDWVGQAKALLGKEG